MRIVIDTNVLINGFQDDFSASFRLVEAVRDGELAALITPTIEREYRKILYRLIKDSAYKDKIDDFLWMAQKTAEAPVDVIIDDVEDIKFLRAAVGGSADAVVTNDNHLLAIGEVGPTRIVTPPEAWQMYEDKTGGASEWAGYIKGWFGK